MNRQQQLYNINEKNLHRNKWTDYSASFKPLYTIDYENPIEMYSYSRPSSIFWNAFMNGLIHGGMTEKQAVDWLLSKKARWLLDGDMADKIEELAFNYAKATHD